MASVLNGNENELDDAVAEYTYLTQYLSTIAISMIIPLSVEAIYTHTYTR